MKNIKKIIPYIILVLVVGLLSLIPYTLEKLNDKEKIVKEKDNFKIKE